LYFRILVCAVIN